MLKKLVIWILLMSAGLSALAGCGSSENVIQVTPTLDEVRLNDLWHEVVEETAIREETAVLETLQLAIAADAELLNMRLVFHARDEAGENAVYSVDMGADGRLAWRRQPLERASYPTQPGALLMALDAIDIAATAAEENGLTLWADTIAGSISYRQEQADIYLLTNGALRPLQEIVFQSQTPWTTITVCPGETETAAGQEDQCQVWFLEQATAKAQSFELAE